MLKKDTKFKHIDRGFTIVELLVVIVVIAILAAISVVAYTGVTTKAKAAQAQSNGSQIQQVAEAYNADAGYYPGTLAAFTSGFGSAPSAVKPSSIDMVAGQAGTGAVPTGTQNLTSGNGQTTVSYSCLTSCTNSTGGRIGYYDFNTSAVVHIYVGAATSGAGSTYVAAPAS